MRWKVRLASQNGITPYPGQHPRDVTLRRRPGHLVGLVRAGVGRAARPRHLRRRLHALRARTPPRAPSTGRHDYPGLPGPPRPEHRQHADLLVAGRRRRQGALRRGRGRAAGVRAATSWRPASPRATRCGSSRPTWQRPGARGARRQLRQRLVVGHRPARPRAGGVRHGRLRLRGNAALRRLGHRPAHQPTARWPGSSTRSATTPACDYDFGATRQRRGSPPGGNASFLGEGSKDGTYYSLDPRTGRLRWSTNVVFGGSSGGFIGTTAYDGRPGLRRHRRSGTSCPTKTGVRPVCDPSDPRDTVQQNPTDHAFDAATGRRCGRQSGNYYSFSAATVAGGMIFNGLALRPRRSRCATRPPGR